MPSPAELLAASKPKRPNSRLNGKFTPLITCRLGDIRKELGLGLVDVAEAVGMSQGAYWGVERGSNVHVAFALKLAAFFGKPVEEIWSLLGDPLDMPPEAG